MSQSSPEAKQRWLDANQHKRPEINRNWKLRSCYGIMPERFQAMLVEQDYKCAICRVEFVFAPVNNPLCPHLDHEHSSGWIRGILCNNCNHGLGQFGDDPDKLQAAIDYLIANAAPTEFNLSNAIASCRQGRIWSAVVRAKMSASAKERWNHHGE
jgi:hypothetical protein